ncbi:hypothetical protein C0213_09905 [Latilactobacillus sakei]|nr:hypothetical protein [Latilactobacillus sakei]AUX12705.1 hypothetical protein C0213_09905 [Latilactobacillus sakei]
MTKRNYGLIALAIGCFAMTSFINHQNVQATETVIKNKARIDNKYPLGGASNFMMVAGNQFVQSESPFSGRIMANSVILKKDWLGAPGFNGSTESSTNTAYDNYFKNLKNPAVIINDFTKGNEKIFDKTKGMKNLVFHLGGMWQNPLVEDGISKNTEFATDTPKADAEAAYPGMSVSLSGFSKGQQGTFEGLWKNKMVEGTNGNLAKLPQYVDNGINKYETNGNSAATDYSLQQNIQDVSDFYEDLIPEGQSFWSSTDEIMDLKQTNPINNENAVVRPKSNPFYITDPWTEVTDVVINIVAKADDPTVSAETREKTKPYAAEVDGKKPIVAVSIDRNRLTENYEKAKHMNIQFHFSDSFYKNEGKTLDPEKIPYIVINYKNFNDKRFDFQPGDGFYIGSIDNFRFPLYTADVGKPGYVNSISKEVGGASDEDWSNPNVLKFGSHLLNNFTDTYDSDNYPELFDQDKQDNSGLTAQTAAVSYTNRSPGTMLFGTMLIPHGSYYAGSSTHGLYIGGVVAANNITLDNAIISPEHDKSVFGNNQEFPDLNDGGSVKKPIIDSIDLNDPGSKNSQSLKSGGTAKFDYADGTLKPAPSLGITGELKLSNVPNSYGLYYRYNSNGNNDKGEWHRYSSGAQTGTSVKLDQESLLADLNNQTKAIAGDVKTEAQKIGYPLTKTSGIEFATTADAKAATLAADKIETTATFNFTLQVKAALEVTVPARISFGTDVLGHSSGEATRTVAINEIQLAQKSVADTGTAEAPKVTVYNPLLNGFNLKLAYLDANEASHNPFYITNNFKYNINNVAPLPLAPDKSDGEWIDGILKRDTTAQSLETRMGDNPLKESSLQLHLPYRNDYQISTDPYEAPMGWQLTL